MVHDDIALLKRNADRPPDPPIITPDMLETAIAISANRESVEFMTFTSVTFMYLPMFLEKVGQFMELHLSLINPIIGASDNLMTKEEAEKDYGNTISKFIQNYHPNETKSLIAQAKLARALVAVLLEDYTGPGPYRKDDLITAIARWGELLEYIDKNELRLAALVMHSYNIIHPESNNPEAQALKNAVMYMCDVVKKWLTEDKEIGDIIAATRADNGDVYSAIEAYINEKLEKSTEISSDKLHVVINPRADGDFDISAEIDNGDFETVKALVEWYYMQKITTFGNNIGVEVV